MKSRASASPMLGSILAGMPLNPGIPQPQVSGSTIAFAHVPIGMKTMLSGGSQITTRTAWWRDIQHEHLNTL